MKKIGIIAVAAVLMAGAIMLASVVLAQDKVEVKQDWSKIQVVTYASGLTGFFDPDTGKLYLYGSDLDKCFIVRQLAALGEPLKKLQN